MKKNKGIGIEVNLSSEKTDELSKELADSGIKIRGRIFIGKVVSKDAHKSARIELTRIKPVRKYERFEHRTSKFSVHNPVCLDCNVGDTVKVVECRPISKTKKFVIVEKIK
jgi:small subunit ribosomal protein S17